MDVAAVGAMTRARSTATAPSVGATASTRLAKRRRSDDGNEPLKLSSNNSTCTQLRNISGGRNSSSPPSVLVTAKESFHCLSTSSEDQASVSCSCSSYGSSEVEKDKLGFTDLEECVEVDSSTSRFSRDRRGKPPSSDAGGDEEVDSLNSSAVKAAEANPPQRSEDEFQSSVEAEQEELLGIVGKPEIKTPSDFEIEAFFAAAEAESLLDLERFKNKYNFDFAEEKPLEGRFEWYQTSPGEKVSK